MPIQLTEREIVILNKVVPTPDFGDFETLQRALRDALKEESNTNASGGSVNELEQKQQQTQFIKRIAQFLREESFYIERDGGVMVITEKGKHLRQQRTLQQYYIWKDAKKAVLTKELNIIRTRGYLDQDEIVHHRSSVILERVRKYVLTPLLVLIVLFGLLMAAHQYHLDDRFPALKNWLDKD